MRKLYEIYTGVKKYYQIRRSYKDTKYIEIFFPNLKKKKLFSELYENFHYNIYTVQILFVSNSIKFNSNLTKIQN